MPGTAQKFQIEVSASQALNLVMVKFVPSACPIGLVVLAGSPRLQGRFLHTGR